ncbi:Putative ABC transporter [Acididesulfobacillus acetoxydans]|uniref:ABC transporter n=1 Tax=Acididesulfobacillus acetoxydans TaxID=1561005 RepID=A0A8S0Y271_9FIRM|nr:energy-coupling factor transporter ATPase [Acididesulfobacillus acetoxydans]CAA7600395.1 Putative ABC transporter [Acididesulfobacillus acetoxydans]CEJ07917.1 Energy-coupling factor transporter ATP-binding protein EcfA 1 [Acididesulfobacillus acetoxydans]
MPDIHVDRLSFSYPDSNEPVLRSLDFKIVPGEFVLVAGASGCGKSTLALTLAGFIPARIPGYLDGAVYFGSQKLSEMPLHEISQRIGMVFQNPDNQLIELDVESEVAFGPENLCLAREEIEGRVAQALRQTGMESLRRRSIFSLSGGQKQRVAIAAMLAMRPQVLVLDEPTSELDPVGTQEVLQVLKELNERDGLTVILVEHKIDEVVPWVDRVLLMDEGQIILDRPPRLAFANLGLWESLGVTVPDMVRVARVLPDVFGNATPLSVAEVSRALRDTRYRDTLIRHDQDRCVREPERESILSWEEVHLAFGEVRVLRDINIEIGAGEWVALIGANGSGKTSLASLAMGFQEPSGGRVSCLGRPVCAGDISKQAGKVGYLFQSADNMLFGSSVEKEFEFGLRHRRGGWSGCRHTIEELLKIVDLSAFRQTNPFQLSHGQRKRLALGVLLSVSPRALILDEPTTGQDEGHARQFLSFLEGLRREFGLTYLMITHDMRAVAEYADRVLVLHEGELHLSGRPEVVFARRQELASCGIMPPAIARLHLSLTDGGTKSVCLSVEEFLSAIKAKEAV